jgi:oligoribonuclease
MFLWLDLETVGLDPDSGEILEVAWFISDNWELLTNVKSHVVTPTRDTFELIKQDMFAQTVHYDNLLMADLLWNRTVLLEDIEDMILRDLHRNNDQDVVPILAGSSVHFDRSFIRKYMPRLDDQLSHRHFDASTLMMFFNSLGYYDYAKREYSSTHRAYNDVQDSYKLARKYVNMMNLLVDEIEDDNDAQRKSQ